MEPQCVFPQLSGSELCSLSRDAFLARTPSSLGDILYMHLQILLGQQEQQSEPEPEIDVVDDRSSSSPSSFTFLPTALPPSPQMPPTTTAPATAIGSAFQQHQFSALSDVGYLPPSSAYLQVRREKACKIYYDRVALASIRGSLLQQHK